MYLKMVGEDLHAKGSAPEHLTAIHKISRSKRVCQQERLTPDDIFPDDILLKHQPSGKVLVCQKSRKPSGNSERARNLIYAVKLGISLRNFGSL